jgi:hypothetical protein
MAMTLNDTQQVAIGIEVSRNADQVVQQLADHRLALQATRSRENTGALPAQGQ